MCPVPVYHHRACVPVRIYARNERGRACVRACALIVASWFCPALIVQSVIPFCQVFSIFARARVPALRLRVRRHATGVRETPTAV